MVRLGYVWLGFILLKKTFYFISPQGLSKLVVCGGFSRGYVVPNTCEVFDLNSASSTCKNLPDFPEKVLGAIEGLRINGNPIICGGEGTGVVSNSCYSLGNGLWVSTDSMNSARIDAAAAQLQDGRIIVTGGFDKSRTTLNTSEILTVEGWKNIVPSLSVAINAHCMVTVNATTVMVIGGTQNGPWSGKTFYYTLGEDRWTEGPELNFKRGFQRCARIRTDKASQEMSVIVAGGDNSSSYISSVEILDAGLAFTLLYCIHNLSQGWPDFFSHGPFSIIFKVLRAATSFQRVEGFKFFGKFPKMFCKKDIFGSKSQNFPQIWHFR